MSIFVCTWHSVFFLTRPLIQIPAGMLLLGAIAFTPAALPVFPPAFSLDSICFPVFSPAVDILQPASFANVPRIFLLGGVMRAAAGTFMPALAGVGVSALLFRLLSRKPAGKITADPGERRKPGEGVRKI